MMSPLVGGVIAARYQTRDNTPTGGFLNLSAHVLTRLFLIVRFNEDLSAWAEFLGGPVSVPSHGRFAWSTTPKSLFLRLKLPTLGESNVTGSSYAWF